MKAFILLVIVMLCNLFLDSLIMKANRMNTHLFTITLSALWLNNIRAQQYQQLPDSNAEWLVQKMELNKFNLVCQSTFDTTFFNANGGYFPKLLVNFPGNCDRFFAVDKPLPITHFQNTPIHFNHNYL